SGITHALGTGGRDLSEDVGGVTARQALDLLLRDPATRLVTLVSKPPAPGVAAAVLSLAQRGEKPVVIHFVGERPRRTQEGNLYFAATLDEAAELAVRLVAHPSSAAAVDHPLGPLSFAAGQRY